MKNCRAVLAVFLLATVANCHAGNPKSRKKNDYISGTVLRVNKQLMQSNYVGDSPSDAPLQSDVFEYEISLRVNCGTYVGLYQSPFDYFSAVFTPNRPVKVRMQKHVMYVDVPGDREYRMGIVCRPHGAHIGCSTSE